MKKGDIVSDRINFAGNREVKTCIGFVVCYTLNGAEQIFDKKMRGCNLDWSDSAHTKATWPWKNPALFDTEELAEKFREKFIHFPTYVRPYFCYKYTKP